MNVRREHVWAVLGCGLLCVVFTALAWGAVRGKSATWDEPSHTATGMLMLWHGDYRLSPDVPPLWEKWIALASPPETMRWDAASAPYRNLKTKVDLFGWCVQTLYRTAGNDGIALVNHSRAMALSLGVALAILIGRWAWRLGGPAAAVAAMFLYCLDPNFLGQAALVKNDVGFALVYFAAAYALWCAGRRLSVVNAAALILLAAAALLVKLSGVLLGPVVLIGLLVRAWSAEPWEIFGRVVQTRKVKVWAALSLCATAVVVTYIGLWAAYGFRFDSGPEGLQSDTAYFVRTLRLAQVYSKVRHRPTAQELAGWKMPLSTRAVVFIEQHHLLPQAWTAGFVLTQVGDQDRAAFLCNTVYIGGRWYYFPLAALFKSPLATIAACLLAAVAGRRALKNGLLGAASNRWAAIALGLPAGVYAAAILTANLNIGLRHAFPLFPFVFVAVALAGKSAWEARPHVAGQATRGHIIVLCLAAALVGETAGAFPNYIAFFNAAAARHRLSLLSDSNLDWGQDLPLLAQWQRENPGVKLYLDYFGRCDPAAYGIRYVNVPQGYLFGPPLTLPSEAGMVAISATNLQQTYGADPMAQAFKDRTPEAILGGTIYLFKFDPG